VSGAHYSWLEAYFTSLTYTCCGVQGHLVTISDAPEQEFVLKLVGTTQVWIGLTDIVNEGAMEWVDGTPFDFEKFRTGEPNDSGGREDCVMMTSDGVGGWADSYCLDTQDGYVVEFDCA
jgi:Lectin C-type domain